MSAQMSLFDGRSRDELRNVLTDGMRARGADFWLASSLTKRERPTMQEKRIRNPHRLSPQESEEVSEAWSNGWDAQRNTDEACGRRYDRHRLAEAASAAKEAALRAVLARRVRDVRAGQMI